MPSFATLQASLHHILADVVLSADATPSGDTAPSGASGPLAGLPSLVPYMLMFMVIYVLIIRPGSKQRREHQDMLLTLKKDDEVITSGGVYGRITQLEEKIATLEIADKVKIRILRDRITARATVAMPSPSTSTPQK